MYRFLLTARWLGLAALMLAMAGTMVALGFWQLSRYHERSAINDRIDASAGGTAAPLGSVLPAPSGRSTTGSTPPDAALPDTAAPATALPGQAPTAGSAPTADSAASGDSAASRRAAPAPPAGAAWTRVTAAGRYDLENQILVRGRTVDDRVGFEVVTPLLLEDGSAVLVDRGWVPPASGGAIAMPDAPAAPTGQVRVAGRVHLSESRPGPIDRRGGWIEVRRVAVGQLAGELPYPVYGAYVLLDKQDPAADPKLTAVPVEHENAWQNAGYVVQWWMFAALTLAGLVWLARREAHGPPDPAGRRDLAAPPSATTPPSASPPSSTPPGAASPPVAASPPAVSAPMGGVPSTTVNSSDHR